MGKRKRQVVSFLLSVCMVVVMLPAAALAVELDVTYLYWENSSGTWQSGMKASGEYTSVQSSDVEWGTGGGESWYVVSGDVSINNSVPGSGLTDTIYVQGTVHLILTDGAVLNCGRIITQANSRLYIYAQSHEEGTMGRLVAGGGIGADESFHTNVEIVINGGKIEAKADGVPAIGSDYGGAVVAAYGGVITAESKGAAGIYADEVHMQGCQAQVKSQQHNGIVGENGITLAGGNITVQSESSNGIFSRGNITFSDGSVDVTAGNGTDGTCGICALGTIQIENQAKVEVENKGTAAAIEGGQGIVISGSEVNTISVYNSGLWTNGSIEIVNGANVSAEGARPAIRTKNDVVIDGSKVTLSGQSDGIWTVDGNINISNSSEVKAEVAEKALVAEGNVSISGSLADLSSSNASGIWAQTGAIEITDGANVTAKGKNEALWAQTGVSVSGSTIIAESAQEAGISSPGTASITDSVVTVKGGDAKEGILLGTQEGSMISGSWIEGTYRDDAFASVDNTLTVKNGVAEVRGAAAVPQGVTLAQGTKIIIQEGGSLKINHEVTITSFPAGEGATVTENGNIDLPPGTVVSVAGELVTVPQEGGNVNFDGNVNIFAISLDHESITIPFGETAVLTAMSKPENAEIIWSSNNEAVAAVDGGIVTGKGEGTAVITAEIENAAAVCQVTVDHKWNTVWSHNDTHHWHDCAAGENCAIAAESEKDGYGEHSLGEWIVDKEPTAEAEGSRHRECTQCGFATEPEVIPDGSAGTPTPSPTMEPSSAPTEAPTSAPTTEPTTAPTQVPTTEPSSAPTEAPTSAPTTEPTTAPTQVPTTEPSSAPTEVPTSAPTTEPTTAPTSAPTSAPTTTPTESPTSVPAVNLTPVPSAVPTTGLTEETPSGLTSGQAVKPVHSHRWASAWKSDNKHHWHNCMTRGCDIAKRSEKDGYGEHIPSDWITDRQPTAEEAGSRHRQCVVCGYIMEREEVPVIDNQKDSEGPFLRNSEGQNGWTQIKEAVKEAEKGSSLDIVMNGSGTVPGDVLDTVKGRDITLAFDMGDGVVWSVNGKQVNAGQAGTIDLSVKKENSAIPEDMAQSTAAGNVYVMFSLAHSGNFGFTGMLYLDLGKENQGYEAVLYYYNEGSEKLEAVGRSQISESGIAGFEFEHASDYMVVIESESGEESNESPDIEESLNIDEETENQSTGNTWIIWLVTGSLLAILGGLGIFFLVRRDQKDQGQK